MTTHLPDDPWRNYTDQLDRPISRDLAWLNFLGFSQHVKSHLVEGGPYYYYVGPLSAARLGLAVSPENPKMTWPKIYAPVGVATDSAITSRAVVQSLKEDGLLARDEVVVQAPALEEGVDDRLPTAADSGNNADTPGDVDRNPSDEAEGPAEDTTMDQDDDDDRSLNADGPIEKQDVVLSGSVGKPPSSSAAPSPPPVPVKRRPLAVRMILPGLCAITVVIILVITVVTHTTYMSFIVFFPVIAVLVAQRRAYRRRIQRLASSVIDEAEYVKRYYPTAYPAYYREAASALIERGAGYLVGKLPAK